MSAAEKYVSQLTAVRQMSGEWKLPEQSQVKTPCVQSLDFDADDWYFYEYAPGKEKHVRHIHIHFAEASGQQTGYLLRQYAAWRLGRVRPVTVRLELDTRLSHWLRYLRVRKITDPRRFGVRELERFGCWLRMQEMTPQACDRILHTVYRLLTTGQRLGWRVTEDELPKVSGYWWMTTDEPLYERINAQQTAAAGKLTAVGATEPIPKDIYEQILRHAVYDETDEITRAGIIIQSQTGLRISEVLSLQENCLKRDVQGRTWLVYSLKKTTKAEPEQRFVPANEPVCEAIGRLQKATEELRRESGRKELFLVRNRGIRPASQTNWNKGRLQNFLTRWGVTDENGQVYELHSHQFRATYVREQLLSGGQIEQIRRRFGHVSPEMTARYVHISEEEMKNVLAPCIGMERGLQA